MTVGRGVRDAIVELDDQPSDPPGHRADRAVIAGLLTASALFGIGVWIARPAIDARPSPPAIDRDPEATPPMPVRPEGRRDLPVFIRPSVPADVSIPRSVVIYRAGPEGYLQIDVPPLAPSDGMRWRSGRTP